MKVLIIAATGVQPLPEPLGRPQSVLELVSAKQPKRCSHQALISGPDEAASCDSCSTLRASVGSTEAALTGHVRATERIGDKPPYHAASPAQANSAHFTACQAVVLRAWLREPDPPATVTDADQGDAMARERLSRYVTGGKGRVPRDARPRTPQSHLSY
jgi:hypothetical protein